MSPSLCPGGITQGAVPEEGARCCLSRQKSRCRRSLAGCHRASRCSCRPKTASPHHTHVSDSRDPLRDPMRKGKRAPTCPIVLSVIGAVLGNALPGEKSGGKKPSLFSVIRGGNDVIEYKNVGNESDALGREPQIILKSRSLQRLLGWLEIMLANHCQLETMKQHFT